MSVVGTSHLLLYIAYYALYGQGLVISFHINACMQGELTSRLSSSWMYIAYIPLLFLIYAKREKNIIYALLLFVPLCWWIDKKGERYFGVLYMHVCLNLLSFTIGIKRHLLLALVSRASFIVLLVSRVFIGIKSNIIFKNMFILKLISKACLFHWYKRSCLFHFLILCMFMHIYVEHSLNILLFIVMHELRGSFFEA